MTDITPMSYKTRVQGYNQLVRIVNDDTDKPDSPVWCYGGCYADYLKPLEAYIDDEISLELYKKIHNDALSYELHRAVDYELRCDSNSKRKKKYLRVARMLLCVGDD
ncbi:hypothetical protein OPW39_23915 [Vibrio europaeus]|uniref:hypothetical protein n=1 Tax=Vibrio europaeus TaxID=300876 RepID=UPI00233EA8DC|nr:hypothetical protein [Vibrio europaeus]MDC5871852.1 hypothetical protein [Vibrio europaeus]